MIKIFNITIFVCFILINLNAYCQNSLKVEGYVISGPNVLPEVSVSIKGKNLQTKTNSKGKFIILREIGDTLIIQHPEDKYEIKKHVITDNSIIIIRLREKFRTNEQGYILTNRVERITPFNTRIKYSFITSIYTKKTKPILWDMTSTQDLFSQKYHIYQLIITSLLV